MLKKNAESWFLHLLTAAKCHSFFPKGFLDTMSSNYLSQERQQGQAVLRSLILPLPTGPIPVSLQFRSEGLAEEPATGNRKHAGFLFLLYFYLL